MSKTWVTTRTIAACASVLLAAGCSGVGDGSKPESLKILQVNTNTFITQDLLNAPTQTAKVYTCVRSALGLFVTFTKGDVGNFTGRATWSSSNPDVVRVSNRDEPVPDNDGLFFDYGSLTPVSPGTATITATYLGKTATIPVEVRPVDTTQLTITPSKITMTPNSFQQFRAQAVLDGVSTDVSAVVNFRFANPNDQVATLDSTGGLSAVKSGAKLGAIEGTAGNPLLLEARFNSPCTDSMGATVKPTANVYVADAYKLRLERETGFYPDGTDPAENRMVRGYTQFIKVIAQFGQDTDADGILDAPVDIDGDGMPDEQDLSNQVIRLALTSTTTDPLPSDGSTPPTIVTFGSNLLGRSNQVTGSVVGSTKISAKYGPVDPGPDGISNTANTPSTDDIYLNSSPGEELTFKIVDGPTTLASDGVTSVVTNPLHDFTIAPSNPTISAAFGQQQFKATGNFQISDGGSSPVPLTHDISRHVLWAVSKDLDAVDSTTARNVVVIGNFPNDLAAGLAVSLLKPGDDAARSTISATAVAGNVDTTPADAMDAPDTVSTTLTLSSPPAIP